MGFLTFWFVSTVVTWLLFRQIVKISLRDDKESFDGEQGMLLFLFIAPFIPIVNILAVVIVGVAITIAIIEDRGTFNLARKLFFIKRKSVDKTEGDE